MSILEYTIGDKAPQKDDQHTLWCHDVGHVIGDIVAGSDAPFSSLIIACGSGRTCGYGCIHGIVVAMARKEPEFFRKINTLCDHKTQCYHGFGHAYAELSGYDMSKSLESCQQINDKQGSKDCAGGVFMEIFQPPLRNHTVSYARPDDELKICESVDNTLQSDCAIRVGESVAQLAMKDISIQECIANDNALAKDCIAGFIQGSIDPVNDPHGAMAVRACEFLPIGYKNYCIGHIGSLLSTRYGQNVAISVCTQMWHDERANICLAGAYETNP